MLVRARTSKSSVWATIISILLDAKITWQHVMIRSVVIGLLFIVGKMAIALYFGKALPGSGYDAAGSIVLILLWVSYSSMILFFGAEFTHAFANLYSGPVSPSEIAKKEFGQQR